LAVEMMGAARATAEYTTKIASESFILEHDWAYGIASGN